MSAISISVLVTIPVRLPVMPFEIGGSSMVASTIAQPVRYSYCVMAEAATGPVSTCSNRTYNRWAMLGIEIRVAHYPPYTSKYNPIEHRLFPHVTRVCQGVIFQSVEMVCELMAKAKTQTGLRVFATVLDKVYQRGRKVSQEFKKTMQIVFDEFLPKWNYTAKPQIP